MPNPTAAAMLPNAVKSRLTKDVANRIKKRYGIAQNQPLPPALSAAITREVNKVSSSHPKAKVVAEVEAAVSQIAQVAALERFDQNVTMAGTAIAHIGASSEVDKILKERAEMMFKKKTALETAGFSSDESMSIILADISARGR